MAAKQTGLSEEGFVGLDEGDPFDGMGAVVWMALACFVAVVFFLTCLIVFRRSEFGGGFSF